MRAMGLHAQHCTFILDTSPIGLQRVWQPLGCRVTTGQCVGHQQRARFQRLLGLPARTPLPSCSVLDLTGVRGHLTPLQMQDKPDLWGVDMACVYGPPMGPTSQHSRRRSLQGQASLKRPWGAHLVTGSVWHPSPQRQAIHVSQCQKLRWHLKSHRTKLDGLAWLPSLSAPLPKHPAPWTHEAVVRAAKHPEVQPGQMEPRVPAPMRKVTV